MPALDGFFESYYRLRPVNATFTGIHDHDHRLPDWSPDGLAGALDEMRALRAAIELPLVALRAAGATVMPAARSATGSSIAARSARISSSAPASPPGDQSGRRWS